MTHLLKYATMVFTFSFALMLFAEVAPLKTASAPTSQPGIDPKARLVLERFADTIRKAKTVSVGIETGMNDSFSHLAIERPNRFALRLEKGMMGITAVADGQHFYTYMPATSKYTMDDQNGTIEEIAEANPIIAMNSGGIMVANTLLHENPAESMLANVTEAKYVAEEKLETVSAHRLKLTEEQFDLELWIDAGDRAVPLKMIADMSRAMQQSGQLEEGAKNKKMELVITFRDWKFDADLPPDTFKFEPPKDTKKVDSLFGGAAEEEPSPMLGEPAPALKLALLAGGEVDLATHKGKNVVVLDFWATWCGPCVMGLPTVTEVTKSYADKGVVFYAVNIREQPEAIRSFLSKKKLDCKVALDTDGKTAGAFQVEGIPRLVIIGKDGIVQVVHRGMNARLKTTLSHDLDAVIAGKSPIIEQKKKEEQEHAATSRPAGFIPAWSVKGKWDSVATDSSHHAIYASSITGRLLQIDANGKNPREFAVKGIASTLRLGNLAGSSAPELLAFKQWGPSVEAVDDQGHPLWAYAEGQGIDDVWTADLNGDGLCETIIGYNGDTGIHVLDNTGKLLWKYSKIGNVWHVCAGDLDGDNTPEVVTTSAEGKVHVFDARGKKIKDMDPGCYAFMVRLAKISPKDRGLCAVIGGMTEDKQIMLVLLNNDGKKLWSVPMAKGTVASIDSMAVANSRPLAAVALRGGEVNIVDLTKGDILAQLKAQGQMPQVAWYESKENKSPLLLVATGREINAYHLDEKPGSASQISR